MKGESQKELSQMKLQEGVNTVKVENADLKGRSIKTYAEVTEGVLSER